jgi:SAM-dependent methyltransferase
VESALDVGCGTGRHCFHFETLGLKKIVGADPSDKMLAIARSRAHATSSETRFIEAAFTNISDKISDHFDVVCSLGNSISHLKTDKNLDLCFKNLRNLLTSDGVILVQLLNWSARIAKNNRYFKPQSHPDSKHEKLFFRFLDFNEEMVTMNLVIFKASDSPVKIWSNRIISTILRPWRREEIHAAVEKCGLVIEHEFGGMDLSFYRPTTSNDYIFIARRA